MLLTPLFLDLDDLIQRDREAEFAKIRSRRVAREQMRKLYRKRRAIAVAVLALPVAGFVFAGKFPSDSKKPRRRHRARHHRGGRSRHHRRAWPGAVRGAVRGAGGALLDVPRERPERGLEVHLARTTRTAG